MATVSALIHFIGEDKTAIVNQNEIPDESRYEGSVCQVKWLNKPCTARVLKISGDMEELDQTEDEFHSQLDNKCSVPEKRRRVKNSKYTSDKATDKEVAHLLNEHPELLVGQKQKKKGIARKSKAATAALKRAQAKLDEDIVLCDTVNPVTSTISTVTSTPAHTAVSSQSTTLALSPANGNSDLRRVLFASEERSSELLQAVRTPPDLEAHTPKDDSADKFNKSLLLENNNNEVPPQSSTCVCSELKNLANPGTKVFWMKVGSLIGVDGVTNQGKKDIFPDLLEPLPITTKEPVVELTKGSGVLISVRAKNQIKLDHKGNPSRMVSELLGTLFGRCTFSDTYVTARGNAPGSKGIKGTTLDAMLSFINRNADRKLTEAAFIRCVNKRATTWRCEPTEDGGTKRTARKVPKQSQGTSKTPVKITPKKTPVKITPINTQSQGTSKTSSVQITPKKTPVKITPMNPAVNSTVPEASPVKKSADVSVASSSAYVEYECPSAKRNSPYSVRKSGTAKSPISPRVEGNNLPQPACYYPPPHNPQNPVQQNPQPYQSYTYQSQPYQSQPYPYQSQPYQSHPHQPHLYLSQPYQSQQYPALQYSSQQYQSQQYSGQQYLSQQNYEPPPQPHTTYPPHPQPSYSHQINPVTHQEPESNNNPASPPKKLTNL